MSTRSDAEFATDHTPYSVDRPLMIRCSCGEDHSPAEHGSLATLATRAAGDGATNFVEASLMKALPEGQRAPRLFEGRRCQHGTRCHRVNLPALCSGDDGANGCTA